MDNIPSTIFIVVLVIAIVAIIVIRSSQNSGQKSIPNYKALFVIGISWVPIGIATGNPTFWGIGIVFFIIGLAKKDQWGKETKWADLPQTTKQIKLALIAILSLALILGLVYFLIMRS